ATLPPRLAMSSGATSRHVLTGSAKAMRRGLSSRSWANASPKATQQMLNAGAKNGASDCALRARRGVIAMVERVQLRRSKGWRMPPNTVKVDRTTKWGNPFVVGRAGGAYTAKV